jgi:endonuclease G, mitochondrial
MAVERRGFDSTFLKAYVPLPVLSDKQKRDASRMLGTTQRVVPYTNFSLVMSASRRLAFFTAVNIDGGKMDLQPRERDRWFFDPRLDKAHQIGGEFYRANPFDRGHLVRRLDPAWGTQAKRAIGDTFFFTNCAPQHEKLNRDTWSNLEDYVLTNTDVHDLRVSVFTGPVFREDDPIHRGIRVPVEYWKVVTIVKKNGDPSVTAYLQTQKNLLGLRDFEFGAFNTYQVKVASIETATGMKLGDLPQFDPMARTRDLTPGREIRSARDVLL